MKNHRNTAVFLLILVVFACVGCSNSKDMSVYADNYMETPAAPVLPDLRMKSVVARPKVQVSRGTGQEISDWELYLLAKMIECEARYEPYEGKVAVGAVILNRVKSSKFPNTIEGVIFQKGQFQPISDGGWEKKEPSKQSYNAAEEALRGIKPTGENGEDVGNALFFIYEEIAGERAVWWFKSRLRYITSIGNHDFYTY
ncbi:MAG: hypothetical protein HPY66_0061 [Firmicutes bacterium]|nr:hypothetical protein [Bacillota bacterium]MDI6707386.1 cell wall hydrolase [Bacillota bacterium]